MRLCTSFPCLWVGTPLLLILLLLTFRLKVAPPTGPQQSTTVDSARLTTNPRSILTFNGQEILIESGSESLKRETVANNNYDHTTHPGRPPRTIIPRPIPALPYEDCNPPMQPGILAPESQWGQFLAPVSSVDGPVYDEPHDPTKDSGYHEYAELVESQGNRRPPLPPPPPVPYEQPQGVVEGYVNHPRNGVTSAQSAGQSSNTPEISDPLGEEYHEYATLTDVNGTQGRPV